ncbi:helix-turn-helix domain-containing protein [Aurantiacibacter spongiae]|uniref:PAS domain-containing protein n=1 Tax=Aurantiacibacter spongiae TaxID=2488860 RepID=A0A3N5DLT5_9SPHN|nr:helix-turn-helix domain-containing protein [Aurantiacibacter spongiae]RPF71775.1 PAS domain-containing protein [Aurantiacibacter spongiae]
MAKLRDFQSPIELLGRESADFFGRLLAMVSDVALVCDSRTGAILDFANGNPDLARVLSQMDGNDAGRPIYELVTRESQGKVRDLMLGNASEKWRQINFAVEDGPDIPVAFRSLCLQDNLVLLAGREDAQLVKAQRRFADAQRKLELTFSRLRDADKRYKSLLNLLDIAVLTVEGPMNRIEELSDEAAGILGGDARKLQGRPLLDFVADADQDEFGTGLEKIRGGGRAVEARITLKNGASSLVRASPFQSGPGWHILVHFLTQGAVHRTREQDKFAFDLLAKLPYGAVFTDRDLVIQRSNEALASLVGLGTPSALVGHVLDEILGTRGLDTAIMAAELRDHGSFHNFLSALASRSGDPIEVDVDGACTMLEDDERFCFLIRPRRPMTADGDGRGGPGPPDLDVQDRVGRMPLKAIVRQTTDAIEKTAIERALDLTGNNRAAAAEMLGVSRQNLYDKIERYGVGNTPDKQNRST